MNISDLTREAIKKEESELLRYESRDTLTDVFRKNVILWDTELFPLLKILRKNQYEYLVGLLKEAGYTVSVDQVGAYLSRTRVEVYKRSRSRVSKNA